MLSSGPVFGGLVRFFCGLVAAIFSRWWFASTLITTDYHSVVSFYIYVYTAISTTPRLGEPFIAKKKKKYTEKKRKILVNTGFVPFLLQTP